MNDQNQQGQRFELLVDNVPQHGNYATRAEADAAAKAAKATHPNATVTVRDASGGKPAGQDQGGTTVVDPNARK